MLGTSPRKLSPQDANTLANLAELVVRQLEKDHLLDLQRLVGSSMLEPALKDSGGHSVLATLAVMTKVAQPVSPAPAGEGPPAGPAAPGGSVQVTALDTCFSREGVPVQQWMRRSLSD